VTVTKWMRWSSQRVAGFPSVAGPCLQPIAEYGRSGNPGSPGSASQTSQVEALPDPRETGIPWDRLKRRLAHGWAPEPGSLRAWVVWVRV
jgi:hypothetical protein